jgi:hypothetical protein
MVKRIHVQANKFIEENTNNEMAISCRKLAMVRRE